MLRLGEELLDAPAHDAHGEELVHARPVRRPAVEALGHQH
jgi:hypothetical protein